MPRAKSPHVLSFTPVAARLSGRRCSRAAAPKAKQCLTLGCDRAIAEELGVTRRHVIRWKRDGLTIWQADTIATRLGVHPAQLWGPDAWARAQLAHDAFDALARDLAIA